MWVPRIVRLWRLEVRQLLGSVVILCSISSVSFAQAPAMADLSSQVEITRLDHGVPHIRGKNLRAAGYGLGWGMTEDYGARTPHGLLRARGEMEKVFGKDSMDGDFINRIRYQRALTTYYRLEKPTREVYEGFADGVN